MPGSLTEHLSPKARAEMAHAIATLRDVLERSEEPAWVGLVFGEFSRPRYAMMVTNQRLLLADTAEAGHWEAIDIVMLATFGLVLPRERMLTIAAGTPDGFYRRELRPIEPQSFTDIPWPPDALALIEKCLATAEQHRPRGLLQRLRSSR